MRNWGLIIIINYNTNSETSNNRYFEKLTTSVQQTNHIALSDLWNLREADMHVPLNILTQVEWPTYPTNVELAPPPILELNFMSYNNIENSNFNNLLEYLMHGFYSMLDDSPRIIIFGLGHPGS